jgi:tripartite-type tricarboxylate transporter receptor subunit TctC
VNKPVIALSLVLTALLGSTAADAQPRRLQEYVVVVKGSSAHYDLASLVAALKAKPAVMNCGAGHPGSTPGGKASCDSFGQSTGTSFSTVPYKSFKAMVSDLNAGQVDFGVLSVDEAQTWIASGKLRALLVSVGAERSPLPGVPTLAEAGFR